MGGEKELECDQVFAPTYQRAARILEDARSQKRQWPAGTLVSDFFSPEVGE